MKKRLFVYGGLAVLLLALFAFSSSQTQAQQFCVMKMLPGVAHAWCAGDCNNKAPGESKGCDHIAVHYDNCSVTPPDEVTCQQLTGGGGGT